MEAICIQRRLIPYRRALALMDRLAAARIQGQGRDALIVCQHPPTVTLGRRAGIGDLLLPPERLAAMGVEVHRVGRGGLATWHGPGQLVAYPICHLPSLGMGVARFVERLEQAVIDLLAGYGLTTGRRPDYPGVWAGGRKLAAVGLEVKSGVSRHGLSLNYGRDLSGFGYINPCGLGPGAVTSIELELGRPVDPYGLRAGLTKAMGSALGLSFPRRGRGKRPVQGAPGAPPAP